MNPRIIRLLNWYQADMAAVWTTYNRAQVIRLYAKPEPWMDNWRCHWSKRHATAYAKRFHRNRKGMEYAFPDGTTLDVAMAITQKDGAVLLW